MKDTMKAIAKTEPGEGASLIRLSVPVPIGNEVLIKVECSAICGGDIHFYKWAPSEVKFFMPDNKFPCVMGHEMSGTIVAIGEKVVNKRVGQRVAFETHPFCGECYLCKTGSSHVCLNMGRYQKYRNACFAEYKLADENMLYVLPDEISFEQGALYEPGGVAMNALEDSHMDPGDSVVIYGCGPIGIMAMQIFKACGAGLVIGIDINEYRIEMARKYADVVINSTKEPALDIVLELTKAHGGADVIVEATAAPSVYKTMFEMARPEANIILVGHPGKEVPIDIKYIGLKCLTIKGHFGRRIWSTWNKLNALQSSNSINLLDTVTHRFSLEQFEEAFAISIKDAGKVLFIHSS